MERFVCIHGHFYQPPRENAWLEAIEIQDSAYPYHDWNERITAECYAPNSFSRILDDNSLIKRIVSNYARMSFNIGPTLLSWLEDHSPGTYAAIIEADRLSMQARSGHGAAMAQAYNHMIMPLSNPRDKRTQVIWGIRDFKYRFGRDPEGMWLPETAVDVEALDIMAEFGIRFTVLAPHQAARFRPSGEEKWTELNNGNIDPSRPYLCHLPSGRVISIFFYDGPISQAVAFEGLLKSGKSFADRLMSGFSDKRNGPQLAHIATDGESYGHHHRFGDMALAYALDYLETHELAYITNYGEFLEKNPSDHEVEIHNNTSWSCSHGVERWKADCGCATGSHPDWNQGWRAPLRDTLDWLRDELSALYEKNALEYFNDPWEARNHYIYVVLDRSEENVQRFLNEHCLTPPGEVQRVRALKLLELQRHAMLMYTSCGWFFDDISGIETVQILQYAGRAMQLAHELFGVQFEGEFQSRLSKAQSNVAGQGTGSDIYTRQVKPREADLKKVAAHYAISSLFEDYGDTTDIYCYHVEPQNYRREQSGKTGVVTGRLDVRSIITGEHDTLSFGLLHLGEQDFNCSVKTGMSQEDYEELESEFATKFQSGSFAELVRLLDRNFGPNYYRLQSLFTDEQRSILQTLLKETLDSFLQSYRQIFEESRILMGFLNETGHPAPKAFLTAAEYTLNHGLLELLTSEGDVADVASIIDEFNKWSIKPDAVELEFAFRRTLEREMKKLSETPSDLKTLQNMERLIDIAVSLPFEINLWSLQNRYYSLVKTTYPEALAREGHSSPWVESFRSIGKKLYFSLDAVLGEDGNQG